MDKKLERNDGWRSLEAQELVERKGGLMERVGVLVFGVWKRDRQTGWRHEEEM